MYIRRFHGPLQHFRPDQRLRDVPSVVRREPTSGQVVVRNLVDWVITTLRILSFGEWRRVLYLSSPKFRTDILLSGVF